MEIVPGVGLPIVRLGQTLRDIEAVAGPAAVVGAGSAAWSAGSPAFGVYFDADGRCDLIEVYAAGPGHDVTLRGVRLLGRPMADVVEDLSRAGLCGQSTCLTVDYGEGFTLWSLGELVPEEEDGAEGWEAVVEGVAVGNVDRAPGAVLVDATRERALASR